MVAIVARVLRILVNMSCEVCEQTNAKYKCPGCGMKTCSLHCVKRHKTVQDCSGVRNKTAYVPMKEFTDRDLLNDYRFLEDVDRKAYSALTDDSATQHQYKGKFRQLKNWCRNRKTWLKLLPPSFSRHQENTSWINKREKVIYWRVQWKFPQSEAEYIDKSVCEERTLCDILSTHLSPDKGDPVHRQRLKKYSQHRLEDLQLFMKVEGRPANSVRYHKLDLNGSLLDNLRYKSLVEFPTIHVTLKEFASAYEVLEEERTRSHLPMDASTVTSSPDTLTKPPNTNTEGAASSLTGDKEDSDDTPQEVHAGKGSHTSQVSGEEHSGKDMESERDTNLETKTV